MCIRSSKLRRLGSGRPYSWLIPKIINEKATVCCDIICKKELRYDNFINLTKRIQGTEAKVLYILRNFEKISKWWKKHYKNSYPNGRFFH